MPIVPHSSSPTHHFIFRVDNLIPPLGQFVDLKFRPKRQVIADLLFLSFGVLSLKV